MRQCLLHALLPAPLEKPSAANPQTGRHYSSCLSISAAAKTVLECAKDFFDDPGVTAEDDYDSEVTVVRSGDIVDPSQPGIYTVIYGATDSHGNKAEQVIRTVIIRDNLPPKFQFQIS
jgi:hypothetical protein